jgi:hypothetical protein
MATSSIEDFRELLNNDIRLDIEKLRDFSRHGIPNEVRGDVWKCLLGVREEETYHNHHQLPKSLSNGGRKSPDDVHYNQYERQRFSEPDIELSKYLRGSINRYQNRVPQFRNSANLSGVLENVLRAFVSNNSSVEFKPELIDLCAPLVYILQDEMQVYLTFERLIAYLDDYFSELSIQNRLVNFTTLFRTVLPDLYDYFEEEEVRIQDWAVSWLRFLLAKELPMECLVRLWDCYFSATDGLDLHPFVCLGMRFIV